jgi:polar amino acid transport system substrate-binding protein
LQSRISKSVVAVIALLTIASLMLSACGGTGAKDLLSTIKARGVMRVSSDPNYKPQSFLNDKGEMDGFDIDVAKEVAKRLGVKVEFVTPDWDTIVAANWGGRWDVSIGSMTITPERQKTLDFTDPYYYTSGQIFIKKGGTQIAGPDDLAGKTVGVGDGTTYYEWLKANTTADVKGYKTDLDAVPDLLNGNIEFWMTAGPTGQQAILEGKPIEFSGKPLYYEDLAMAIKKGETDLVALLNYTVRTMHENGALTAMSKKWYNGIDLSVKE